MELIVSYVGRTMIGSMVRFGKVPTNPELAGVIENCQGCGEFDRSEERRILAIIFFSFKVDQLTMVHMF